MSDVVPMCALLLSLTVVWLSGCGLGGASCDSHALSTWGLAVLVSSSAPADRLKESLVMSSSCFPNHEMSVMWAYEKVSSEDSGNVVFVVSSATVAGSAVAVSSVCINSGWLGCRWLRWMCV